MKDILQTLFYITVIIVWPVLLIWSINTLFDTGIDITVFTWFTALIMSVLISDKDGVRK